MIEDLFTSGLSMPEVTQHRPTTTQGCTAFQTNNTSYIKSFHTEIMGRPSLLLSGGSGLFTVHESQRRQTYDADIVDII